ncbi:MAG: GNAT family N-acetyltransferase [Faecousia sp.]
MDVSIREFKFEDIPLKIRWINDPENNYYLHYNIPLEYEATCAWFANKNNTIRYDCVILVNERPVGLIGLLAIDKINSKAEYYISMGEQAYKRKGVASRATKMILRYAFEELLLNKVYLNVDADNVAACSLYEKNGFQKEGRFREDLLRRGVLIDRIRYAIFRNDYESEKADNEYLDTQCGNAE